MLFRSAKVAQLVSTLRSIGAEIRAETSVLWNPYDDEGRIRVLEAKRLTECESSRNDEAVVARWRGKALRLLVRRIPQSAQEIVEARVAVVGNVVSVLRCL